MKKITNHLRIPQVVKNRRPISTTISKNQVKKQKERTASFQG